MNNEKFCLACSGVSCAPCPENKIGCLVCHPPEHTCSKNISGQITTQYQPVLTGSDELIEILGLKKKPIDNEKYSSILLFKNAVSLLVSGATAKDLELEEVLEALGEVKRDYEVEIKRQSKDFV